jgi:hypothetical protein
MISIHARPDRGSLVRGRDAQAAPMLLRFVDGRSVLP